MQIDLLSFSSNFSISISTKFITQTHKQKKLILLVSVANGYFFNQLSNLPGNFMVYYTVAKIC